MTAILLAVIIANASGVCAAAATLTTARPHPCCPAPRNSAPAHCLKLGCFMSDPAIRPAPLRIASGAWRWAAAGPLAALLPAVAGQYTFWFAPPSRQRLITYRQLLI